MAPPPRSASHRHTHVKLVHHHTHCPSVHLKEAWMKGRPTMRATNSERCRPYLATTGLRTSVTGLVGFAFRPTERLIGTKSSLENERKEFAFSVGFCSSRIISRPGLTLTACCVLLYLNRVRFSSRRSREDNVIQSWSKTSGWESERQRREVIMNDALLERCPNLTSLNVEMKTAFS